MSKISNQIRLVPLRFCQRCKGIAQIAVVEVAGAIGKWRFQCEEHAAQARHAQHIAEELQRNVEVRRRALLAEPPLCFSNSKEV